MGKSQKKRAMRRHNPMRVPDTHLPHGLASAESSSSKTEAVLPILQKLNSADATERKWACVAVSSLIYNDPSTRRLLQGKNIVGQLITRLTDSEEEVIAEAMGSLRNLCVDGGYDICAEMYNKNILAPVKPFVPKISSTMSQCLADPAAAPEGAQKSLFEFSENVITLLWCLSETSNKALNAINGICLGPLLISFLAFRDSLPLAPVVAASQCLYVLTDDNYPAIAEVRSEPSYVDCLVAIARSGPHGKGKQKGKSSDEDCDSREMTIRILAAGILHNISPLPSLSAQELDRDVVLPLIQPLLDSVSLADAASSAQALATQVALFPNPESTHPAKTRPPKSDHRSPEEIELERLESHLRMLQLALEVLTGVCATLPDDVEVTANGAKEDDGEDRTQNVDEDMKDEDDDDEDGDGMAVDGLPPDTERHQSLLPSLVPPLLALVQPTALSFPPLAGPSPHPPTTSVLSAIHVCALECLNNIFISLAASRNDVARQPDEGMQIWNTLWAALDAVGTEFGAGQERRKEMWEVAVGVLWGVGRFWRGALEPRADLVQVLIQFCDTTTDQQIRVKCIGALECLAQHPASIELNNTIATYLLSMLPKDLEPSPAGTEPLLQALSALIDIYSDESMPYDVNFRSGGFLTRLVQSVEGVWRVVRSIDRKRSGGRELRRRGEEVRDNLVAFIEYRRELKF
ncbi:ARM repeat-containing protein [Fistulina hepatica ATCC 64428]|uniref:ARM repeat-containing protein n=1 Tax=Fistulina hepatica ATCC 64428 TaxID=1128425 RepID=A0A0D7AH44_9AGAR|nr:ARM repeat-containing protein [Fistulina hepatica ATCC 64428]